MLYMSFAVFLLILIILIKCSIKHAKNPLIRSIIFITQYQ